MANYCYNDITICAKEGNLVDLEFLHTNLVYLFEKNERYCNDIFKELLTSFDKDPIKFDSRDNVNWYMDTIECNENGTYNFTISIESAYVPIISKIEIIIYELYGNNIWCVGTAEEPSDDIYINTDEEGEFYETRYRLIFYYDNTNHNWYLESLPELILRINKIYSENNYGESIEYSADAYEVSESVIKFNNSELAKSKELEIAIYTFEDSDLYE